MNELQDFFNATLEYNRLYRSLQTKLKEHGITPQGAIVLSLLQDGQSKNCTELSTVLQVTLPRVSAVSEGLVLKGYLDRHKLKSNKKVHMLTITDKGQEALKSLEQVGV